MKNIKTQLGTLVNGVLQNILTTAVIIIIIPILVAIYSFWSDNPETALLIILTLLTTINTIASLYLVKQQMPKKSKRDSISRIVSRQFDVKNKYFDPSSSPQRITILFTNRGDKNLEARKIRFMGHDIPTDGVSSSYKREEIYAIIPFDKSKSVIEPGANFQVDIELSHIWKQEDINRSAGSWGFLIIDVIYDDKPIEILKTL